MNAAKQQLSLKIHHDSKGEENVKRNLSLLTAKDFAKTLMFSFTCVAVL